MSPIEFLNREQLAEKLGVTQRHLCNLEKVGLPSLRLGSAVRYRFDEVLAFLDANRIVRMTVRRRNAARKLAKPQPSTKISA